MKWNASLRKGIATVEARFDEDQPVQSHLQAANIQGRIQWQQQLTMRV